MDYRKLGNSGAVVTAYCIGTMTFGAESDEATSHAILDDYFAWGGNFIDTADVYSSGKSEEIIGRWLKARPTEAAKAIIATKGRFPMGSPPNDLGLSRRHLNQALNASLVRLGVEHIDLYQMHAWDALTPIDETLRFLDDAVAAGKIGYYGFSNYVGWHIAKAVGVAKAQGYTLPVTLQPQYNLLVREIELEIVDAARRRLANRQIQARRAADRRYAARRKSEPRWRGLCPAQLAGTHLDDHRHRRGFGEAEGDQHGAGGAGMDRRQAGRDLRYLGRADA
jgi:aryl-alcohol dehydrogenase-like predicted oxidoreductase